MTKKWRYDIVMEFYDRNTDIYLDIILLFCIKWHFQPHCSCFLFIKYIVVIYIYKVLSHFLSFKTTTFCQSSTDKSVFIEASNQLFMCKNHFVPNLEMIKNVNRLKILYIMDIFVEVHFLYIYFWMKNNKKKKNNHKKKDSENCFISFFIECYVQKIT